MRTNNMRTNEGQEYAATGKKYDSINKDYSYNLGTNDGLVASWHTSIFESYVSYIM